MNVRTVSHPHSSSDSVSSSSAAPDANPHHVALIVEDDPVAAETLRGIVVSLGHIPITVSTREAALAEIAKRDFCYAFLDMDLPDCSTAKPSIVTGLTLLKIDLRRAFPGRTASDKHRTQIIAMTAKANDPDLHTRVMQEGADDVLVKPFGEDVTKIADKVDTCLRHSDRRDHARCGEATKAATRASVVPPPSTRMPPKVALHVTARGARRRHELVLAGRAMTCTDGTLQNLLTFAAARAGGAPGWIHRLELGREDAVYQAISRVNREFRQILREHGIKDLLTGDVGKYRIDEGIVITIDEALTAHESAAIRQLAIAFLSGVPPVRAKKLSALVPKAKLRSRG